MQRSRRDFLGLSSHYSWEALSPHGALVYGARGPGSSPGRGHCVVFLGTNSHVLDKLNFINLYLTKASSSRCFRGHNLHPRVTVLYTLSAISFFLPMNLLFLSD